MWTRAGLTSNLVRRTSSCTCNDDDIGCGLLPLVWVRQYSNSTPLGVVKEAWWVGTKGLPPVPLTIGYISKLGEGLGR